MIVLSFIGINFWKVGNRKLYTVLESQTQAKKRKGKGKKRQQSDDSGDEIELKGPSNQYLMDKLDLISLVIVLKQTFRCTICLSIIKPPIILARCCKNVLGCQDCVNELYRGEGLASMIKKCPICRAQRGFSETCQLNGFDDFWNQIG